MEVSSLKQGGNGEHHVLAVIGRLQEENQFGMMVECNQREKEAENEVTSSRTSRSPCTR